MSPMEKLNGDLSNILQIDMDNNLLPTELHETDLW